MDSLDLILQKIEEDNLAEINAFIEEKKNEIKSIMDKAESDGMLKADEILKDTNEKTSIMLENSTKECEKIISNAQISAKNKIIENCIKSVKSKFNKLPDDEYFSIIKELVLLYYHPNETGKLCMNSFDIQRMPKGFLKEINKEIKKNDAELTIDKNSINIEGGFIIAYNGIEENCTLDSLINHKIDIIKDKLYALIRRTYE